MIGSWVAESTPDEKEKERGQYETLDSDDYAGCRGRLRTDRRNGDRSTHPRFHPREAGGKEAQEKQEAGGYQSDRFQRCGARRKEVSQILTAADECSSAAVFFCTV